MHLHEMHTRRGIANALHACVVMHLQHAHACVKYAQPPPHLLIPNVKMYMTILCMNSDDNRREQIGLSEKENLL